MARFREGTRVRYKWTLAEAAYGSTGAKLPEPGELGTVTALPTGRGKSTTMGFLTYVDWDSGLTVGVSTGSLERVGKTSRNPAQRAGNRAAQERLHITMSKTGIIFSDRRDERNGDYKRCAVMSLSTFELRILPGCPKELHDEIIAYAAIHREMVASAWRLT